MKKGNSDMTHKKEHSNFTPNEQATAAFVNTLNTIRGDHLFKATLEIDVDYKHSQMILSEGRAAVKHIISSNRGGYKGMHGFLGEITQVFGENSRSAVNGCNIRYHWINNNGPADYLRDSIEIQQKACRSGGRLGLDHVLNHAETYPAFVQSGGIYQIPRDFFQRYNYLRNLSASNAGLLRKEEYKLWKMVQEFPKQNPDIKIEPMSVTYSEIQAESVESTLDKIAAENTAQYETRKANAKFQNRATLQEGIKTAMLSSLLEGGFSGTICIAGKIFDGKKIKEFDKDDWKKVGIETAKGSAKGAIRGAVVYAATNLTNVSAPVATATVTATYDIADEVVALRKGDQTKAECIRNIAIDSSDILVSTGSAILGSKYLPKMLPPKCRSSHPAILLCTIAGNLIGTYAWKKCRKKIFDATSK